MKSTTTLAFTGDIGFDHYMQNKWEDEHLIDERLVKILTSSDHVIANVEGPLVGDKLEKVKAAEMRLMHTISPEATVVLKRIHADIWRMQAPRDLRSRWRRRGNSARRRSALKWIWRKQNAPSFSTRRAG